MQVLDADDEPIELDEDMVKGSIYWRSSWFVDVPQKRLHWAPKATGGLEAAMRRDRRRVADPAEAKWLQTTTIFEKHSSTSLRDQHLACLLGAERAASIGATAATDSGWSSRKRRAHRGPGWRLLSCVCCSQRNAFCMHWIASACRSHCWQCRPRLRSEACLASFRSRPSAT